MSVVADTIQRWQIDRFAGQVQCFYRERHSVVSDCSKLFPFTALICGGVRGGGDLNVRGQK